MQIAKGEFRPLTLKGVRPHPKTGILWLRLRTPARLAQRRRELEALGVEFRSEHHRSLATRDRRQAESTYSQKRHEIETAWQEWDELLRLGPTHLSFKNIVAIAGEAARSYFEMYQDDPILAESISIPEPDFDHEKFQQRLERLPQAEIGSLERETDWYMTLAPLEKVRSLTGIYDRHPFLWEETVPVLRQLLEKMFGPKVDSELRAKSLHVDVATRRLMLVEMFRFMGIAQRALVRRTNGDWSPVPELQALPVYEAPKPQAAPKRDVKERSEILTFCQVIDEQKRLGSLHLEGQVKAKQTLKKYRQDIRPFTDRRGSEDILTVTAGELAGWRDEMLELADLGVMRRKTIINRLSTVRSLVNWAIEQNRAQRKTDAQIPEIFRAGNPLVGVYMPTKQTVNSEERTATKEEARALLRAAREETDPALRWVAPLAAYSGMRLGEILQLEKRDLMYYERCPYLKVRSDDERTTKTHRERRIPIHKALIAEGFIEFVGAAPAGKLFPGSMNRVSKELRLWVKSVIDLQGKPPIHCLRHLFEDLSTGLELGAKYYIEGRALPGSAEMYGKSPAMVPTLTKMINRIRPLLPPKAVSERT